MIDAPLIVDALSARPDPPERGRGSARRVRRVPAVTRRDGVRERRGVFPVEAARREHEAAEGVFLALLPAAEALEAPSRPELFRHVRQRERRAGPDERGSLAPHARDCFKQLHLFNRAELGGSNVQATHAHHRARQLLDEGETHAPRLDIHGEPSKPGSRRRHRRVHLLRGPVSPLPVG